MQVELLDPDAVSRLRDSQEPDHQAIDDGNRGAPRGDQLASDPVANVFIRMDQRCACDQFLAGSEVDVRHGVGVTNRGRPKIENHYASSGFAASGRTRDVALLGATAIVPRADGLADAVEEPRLRCADRAYLTDG
jgi:hypothetical protein